MRIPDNSNIVIFGASGDLSFRKLIPALYQLYVSKQLPDRFFVLGVSRSDYNSESYREALSHALVEHSDANPDTSREFLKHVYYLALNTSDASDYQQLSQNLNTLYEQYQTPHNTLFYLATPPSLFTVIPECLSASNLLDQREGWKRIIIEKPLGYDLASAIALDKSLHSFFQESQIYRIDHYLGKETVLNLLVLRFANSLFTTNWDRNSIDHVQITVAESVGIEGRWGFYDEAGQMRDMIQNHLLQILSLLAMEPPADLSAESIRAEKLKAVKALCPIDRSNIKEKAVRGQYSDGFLNGVAVPGYLNEEGANTESNTETFVAVKAEIDNWRWTGVPFYLRTGKRMPVKHSEIVVHFKEQPHNIFKDSYSKLPSNKLTIRLQPDEGVELQMMNKIPGIASQMNIQENKLDLSFNQTYKDKRVVDAYERLMLEVLNGNQSLFVSRDEVEAAWTWADSIIDAWQATNEKPKPYAAGSWGPVSSISLIARDDRQWVE